MRTIYVDSEHKCHTTNDGTMTAVEVEGFFDGKCDTFVEGHCYEIGENGVSVYPWKPKSELDKAQRQYERQLLTEYAEALRIMGVTV